MHHNDGDLTEICIGWPLLSMSALESVVEANATNTSFTRLDIREGDTNLYPDPMDMSDHKWWYGKEHQIADLIVSCLQRNKSITEIYIKAVSGLNLLQFVCITRFCHQLEKVIFH